MRFRTEFSADRLGLHFVKTSSFISIAAFAAATLSGCDKPPETAVPAATSVPAAPAAAPVQTDVFVQYGKTISFGDTGDGGKYLGTGWMNAEGWGVWTASPKEPGTVTLPINRASLPKEMAIKFWGQLGPGLTTEEFTLTVAGSAPVTLKVEQAQPIVDQVIPFDDAARAKMAETGELKIEVLAPHGKSPKQMGLNTDERILGFGLREITVR